MFCWQCGGTLELPPGRKISFREECPKCQAALHCCKNCTFYMPGKPNDCAVPNTDYISDRTKMNFCEEFKLLGKPPSTSTPSKNRFDDLFKT